MTDGEEYGVLWDRVFMLAIALILAWFAINRLSERVTRLENGKPSEKGKE